MKYQYLDDYIIEKKGKRVGMNAFNTLTEEEILEAEKFLGSSFPSELRQFYIDIGCGTLQVPFKCESNYKYYNTNEILPPLVAVRFSKGILKWEGQQNWMSESTYELLEPGDLPFFEIGDSTDFLVMKLYSDNRNAVWDPLDGTIEDSFENFVRKLYYTSPDYFYRKESVLKK